jgi:tetratricopeptide (TPR) repeat protein
MTAVSARDTTKIPDDSSLFTNPRVYRAVLAARNGCADAAVTVVFFAAALWWEATFIHARPSYLDLAAAGGWLRWWVQHGMIPVPPAAVAAVLLMVGLRIGSHRPRPAQPTPASLRRSAIAETLRAETVLPMGLSRSSAGWITRNAALYVAAVGLAALALSQSSGSLLARFVPAVAAVLVAWRWRRLRSRRKSRQARRPTEAGFRPSLWAAMSPWAWAALGNVDTAAAQVSFISTSIADTLIDESAARFCRKGDHRSEAYCLARAIGYMLARNRIADAEARSRAVIADAHLGREPTALAARAQYLTAVGQHAEALQMLLRARRAVRRSPVQLDALILTAAIDSGHYENSRQWRWSRMRRLGMIWRGQPSAVILGLAADTRLLEQADPDGACELAYQVCRLPGQLLRQLPDSDFGVADYQRAQLAKGIALDVAARIYQRRGQHPDASAAFLNAYDEFESIKDRTRGAAAMVRAVTSALATGPSEPGQESHALDLMRAGLQLLEDDRGTLRGEDSRASWVAAQRQLYGEAFGALTSVTYMGAKAGELGLWLLESLHRTLTADLMRSAGALESDPQLLAALTELSRLEHERQATNGRDMHAPATDAVDQEHLIAARERVRARLTEMREAHLVAEPTNTETVLSRLGDRVALLFHCWREETGWYIHSALASPRHGIRVRKTTVTAPPASETISPLLTPAGALDALDRGDVAGTSFLFDTPLDEQMWAELAHAVLPPDWWDVLCSPDGSRVDLLVVPDGPIASLPLPVLPVRDGKPLIEYATVALTPALTVLQPPRPLGNPAQRRRQVAVIHLDEDTTLPATVEEAKHWRAAAQHMQVIDTAGQDGIESALHGPPRPDVITISVHGTAGDDSRAGARIFGTAVHLRDGSLLSSAAALRLPWPETVILGACWISGVSIGAGREPFGFPVACLLRGATTITGGIAPIPDTETAHILGHLIDKIPDGAAVVPVLREAQRAVLRGTPAADLTPAQVCGLVTWTTAPAANPYRGSAVPLHWDTQGLPRDDALPTAILVPTPPLGEATQRVLTHARYLAGPRPVGTLGFLASAFTTDTADWTSFTIACEIGQPTLPGPIDEATGGITRVDLGEDRLTITTALAQALRRGQNVATYMHDEIMLPAHVVLAALCDDGTAVAHWLRGHGHQAAAQWARHLGDRIFGGDIPPPHVVLGLGETAATEPVHENRIAAAAITPSATPVDRWRKWAAPAAVAAILLLLPVSTTVAYQIQTWLSGRGSLALVLGDSPQPGALVMTVEPGSSADRAGLHVGDIITAVATTPIRSAHAAILAIQAQPPGTRVRLTIVRQGRPIAMTALLAKPIPPANPGYLGATLKSDPPTGVQVVALAPGGPGATAGLLPGDIITAISGASDGGSSNGAVMLIQQHHPGQAIHLSILRKGQPSDLTATLGSPPNR